MTLRIVWETPDPEGTAMRLASVVGGHVDRRPVTGGEPAGPSDELIVPLVGGEVAVIASSSTDRLVVPASSATGPAGRAGDPEDVRGSAGDEERAVLRGAPVLLGVGWATVDAGRAGPEIAAALGLSPDAFRSASRDDVLGAEVRIARRADVAVLVLEPATEGRLAAALARVGEGPCAIYVATASSAATQPGPLGPAVLAMADRRWGPYVVAVRRRVAAPR